MKRIKKLWNHGIKVLATTITNVVDDFWGSLRIIVLAIFGLFILVPVIVPISIVIIIYRKIRGKK